MEERVVLTTCRHNHHVAAGGAALVHQLAQRVLLRVRVIGKGDLVSGTTNVRRGDDHYNEIAPVGIPFSVMKGFAMSAGDTFIGLLESDSA